MKLDHFSQKETPALLALRWGKIPVLSEDDEEQAASSSAWANGQGPDGSLVRMRTSSTPVGFSMVMWIYCRVACFGTKHNFLGMAKSAVFFCSVWWCTSDILGFNRDGQTDSMDKPSRWSIITRRWSGIRRSRHLTLLKSTLMNWWIIQSRLLATLINF